MTRPPAGDPVTAPPTVAVSGPVSARLEAELAEEVRRRGLVFWLDADGHYTAFVDRRRPRTPGFELVGLRGSHLSLMLELEALTAGVDRPALVIHVPGHHDASVAATPLLELARAGHHYKRALSTLITEAAAGVVAPEAVAELLAEPGLDLDRADAWLAEALSAPGDEVAAALRRLGPAALADALIGGALDPLLAEAREAVRHRLGALFGLPEPWWTEWSAAAGLREDEPLRADDVLSVAAAWALSVEYVDDLSRPPLEARLEPARGLARPLVDACRGLAEHLRERHADRYRRLADDTESLLPVERRDARAQDLGRVDTFRFEEQRILDAALAAVEAGDWDLAAGWSGPRAEGHRERGATSPWLSHDFGRQAAWQVVDAAAALGRAIRAAGALGVVADGRGVAQRGAGLQAAVEAYVARGAAVDTAHRRLEQTWQQLRHRPGMPEFDRLRARLDQLRAAWRSWADAWARDFNALCRAEGFLPPPPLRQRGLFDEVVLPLGQAPGTTAYFLVDALRYELGEALRAALEPLPATTVRLEARLAELPTVTEVGMNVLAPVAAPAAEGGRLAPELDLERGRLLGFTTGVYRVHGPESRQRAMRDRFGGDTCPLLPLSKVVDLPLASLRQSIARARLVLVHSQELDEAGEAGFGPKLFEDLLRDLKAAWRRLREAGVRRFVITGDHGFLLVDDGPEGAQAHGRPVDAHRRHVLSATAADRPGEVRVPLASLGYAVDAGQLVFPETTAVFESRRRPSGFVHGGNSLQERVIPVLSLVHRAAPGASGERFRLAVEAARPVVDLQCLKATLEPEQGSLGFGGRGELELALRVSERPGVEITVCEVRGAARLEAGAVVAEVGREFEVFFQLHGGAELEGRRVRVELHHPGGAAELPPAGPEARFEVRVRAPRREPEAATPAAARVVMPPAAVAPAAVAPAADPGRPGAEAEPEAERPEAERWLDELPASARPVFAVLARHGVVAEPELVRLLGTPRAARRFSVEVDDLARRAGFGVRTESVAGVKRYVREG